MTSVSRKAIRLKYEIHSYLILTWWFGSRSQKSAVLALLLILYKVKKRNTHNELEQREDYSNTGRDVAVSCF